jgi:hypothetical protein
MQIAKKASITSVRHEFRTQFHTEAPNRISIYVSKKKFEQKGCICKGKIPGNLSVFTALSDSFFANCRTHTHTHTRLLWGSNFQN